MDEVPPEIFENPVLLEFFDWYWGTKDYLITCYHSNSPYPGREYQQWHRDGGVSRLVPHVGLEVCPHFSVKSGFHWWTPLKKIEASRCCHLPTYLADPELEARYDEILETGNFPTRRRLNLKKGTLWIQDPRTLHRGTPNHSDHPRPELVIFYFLPWFAQRIPIEMTQPEFDKLSERVKKMLTRCRIVG